MNPQLIKTMDAQKQVRLHKVLVDAVNNNLKQIFTAGCKADKVIEYSLKSNKRWGARDRAFIASATYDIVRWIRLFDFCLKGNSRFEPQKLHDFYGIIAVYLILNKQQLPDWKEFSGITEKLVKLRHQQALQIPAIAQSYPDWLFNLAEKALASDWLSNAAALNQQAPTILRVNTLKISIDKLLNLLQKQGINCTKVNTCEDALLVTGKPNLFKLDLFKQGFFELQDVSSQQVARFLNVKPGEKVIDACAGAGGKTLHLAALMQNKGRIISMDVEDWKLAELKKRAARAGASNIETVLITSNDTIKNMAGKADKLLLDVPCSGLGVLRRNPDSKWKLTPEFINGVIHLQQQILSSYSDMLKPGGILVYATCSILPAENRMQIDRFLQNNNQFEWVEDKIILPAQHGFDGFYMAKLKRRAN